MKSPYDSILFDVDGTLWDTTGPLTELWNSILKNHGVAGVTLTRQDLKNTFGKLLPEILEILAPGLSVPQQQGIMDDCNRLQTPTLLKNPGRLYDGVRETLETLKKTYRLFVVSNCEEGYIETLIETCHFEGLFEDFECYGYTRLPKAGSARLLIERNGLKDPVYVGDTQGDLEACEEVGMPFIYAAYGFGSPDHWTARIERPPELLDLLL